VEKERRATEEVIDPFQEGEGKIEEELEEIAGQLRQVMVPLKPPVAFVRSLGQELVEASRHQQKATRRLRRGLIIGAAALGSVASVAGVVTLLLRRKRAHAQPHPAHG